VGPATPAAPAQQREPGAAGQPPVAAGLLPADTQPAEQPGTAPASKDQPSALAAGSPPTPMPTLEDVAGLQADSDFRPFVSRGIAPAIKNAAMKKLFADPHFNVMDGLDIYIDDYSIPSPLSEQDLKKMVAAQFIKLVEEEPPPPPPSVPGSPPLSPPPSTQADDRLPAHAADGQPTAATAPAAEPVSPGDPAPEPCSATDAAPEGGAATAYPSAEVALLPDATPTFPLPHSPQS
ncbi:MAG: DUF3306 domain-containing protein, partial [Burkholderiales bacterium]|nr:DUF3306 domain-containing protein [Burkholderiales bacterium]